MVDSDRSYFAIFYKMLLQVSLSSLLLKHLKIKKEYRKTHDLFYFSSPYTQKVRILIAVWGLLFYRVTIKAYFGRWSISNCGSSLFSLILPNEFQNHFNFSKEPFNQSSPNSRVFHSK